jgi:hypothetical protein
MLVLLLGSAPPRAPDLQVEAATAAGADLPELADAVARALVASGARVVLRGPSSGSCQYCARVTVTETRQGTCQVEVRQDRHAATATLHLPAASSLFDRARAIAIQARLLVTWDSSSGTRGKEVAARPHVHKPEARPLADRSEPQPDVAAAEPLPALSWEPPVRPPPEPAGIPLRESPVAGERRAPPAPLLSARAADRPEPKPPSRAEARPATRRAEVETREPERSGSRRSLPVDITTAGATPPRPWWPWIPTGLGVGAAVGAALCAVAARNRYDALADKGQPYDTAKSLKTNGERWQLASFVLAGAAAAGIGTGIVGFATRSSGSSSVTALAAPVPGGGMMAVAGALP